MQKRDVLIVESLAQANGGLFREIFHEQGYFPQVVTFSDSKTLKRQPHEYAAIVVMGGLTSANESPEIVAWVKKIVEAEVPFIGVCYGLQVLAKAAGCDVVLARRKEIGFRNSYPSGQNELYGLQITEQGKQDPLLSNLPLKAGNILSPVFQLHEDTITYPFDTNEHVSLLAMGADTVVPNQMIKVGTTAYGMQNHPELTREALNVWLEEPTNYFGLTTQQKEHIRADFNWYEEVYTATGRQLILNFIELIHRKHRQKSYDDRHSFYPF